MPKQTYLYPIALTLVLCMAMVHTKAQQQPKEKTITKLTHNAEKLNSTVDKQTQKYLRKLERQERKILRKLHKADSTLAKQLQNPTDYYNQLQNKLQEQTGNITQRITDYLPGLDSTTTALKFIVSSRASARDLTSKASTINDKAKQALDQYHTLQQKLQNATDVKKLLQERKAQLQELAKKYNLTKHLGKYNKQAYYYAAQLNEYKQALKDPQKAEQVVLKLLNKIPAFQNFFAQFSLMGQLFPQPQGGINNIANLAGLQTRAQVQQQLQTLAGSIGGGNQGLGMATMQQNVQQAQQQLGQLRDRVAQAGGSSSDFDMPDFSPNNQKTKSFLKRFELKTDVQSTRGSSYLPNMADIAVGIGYKLADNKTIGVAAAYKMGLGNGFNNIKLTTEGLGLRSYADIKFGKKANLWATGGYERNYFTNTLQNTALGISNVNQLAVAGISKKYSIGKKRKGEMKLLYNFLWRTQIGSQQFIYRTGINF